MRMVALFAALAAAAAQAQQVDCANAQVQVEITYCAEQGWLRADAELNRAWGRAKAMAQSLDADQPEQLQGIWQALLDGQRAWITYRDKTCEAEGGFMRGGTAEPMVIYGCRERLTWTRVDELEQFANGP